MAPNKASTPPYNKDEKVLCFHHEMLYEAKILEVQQMDDGGFQYKIHYKGWKNTWDDWVPQDRIRKFNEENRELAAQLTQAARASNQKSSKPVKKAGPKNGSDFSSARGSEERTGGASALSGRGPRRARDFDLEHIRRRLITVVSMSANQTNEGNPALSPFKPGPLNCGGISIFDWPVDIIAKVAFDNEAKCAKKGLKYNFRSPVLTDWRSRVKNTKDGFTVDKHRDIHLSPSKDKDKAPAPKSAPGQRAAPRTRQLIPVRDPNEPSQEDIFKQVADQAKKDAIDQSQTKGGRSSGRLLQKAQAALERSKTKEAQQKASQLKSAPAAPLVVQESAMRSTLSPREQPDPVLSVLNSSASKVQESAMRSTLSPREQPDPVLSVLNTSKPKVRESAMRSTLNPRDGPDPVLSVLNKSEPKVRESAMRSTLNPRDGPDPVLSVLNKSEPKVRESAMRSTLNPRDGPDPVLSVLNTSAPRTKVKESAMRSTLNPRDGPDPVLSVLNASAPKVQESALRSTLSPREGPDPVLSVLNSSAPKPKKRAPKSTGGNTKSDQNLSLDVSSNLPEHAKPASNAKMASVGTDTTTTGPQAGSKSKATKSGKTAVSKNTPSVSINAEIPVEKISTCKTDASELTEAPKAAASTKTKTAAKSTAAGSRTPAKTTITASSKPTANKMADAVPKIEGSHEPMIAQTAGPKKSRANKASESSARPNANTAATHGTTGKKRRAETPVIAAAAKRPRIGRACDMCRDKKTRCDGNKPCEACTKRKFDCVYGDGEPKPNGSTQYPGKELPGENGPSKKSSEDKTKSSGTKSNKTVAKASATNNTSKANKRKREENVQDVTVEVKVQPTGIKSNKTVAEAPAADGGSKSNKRKRREDVTDVAAEAKVQQTGRKNSAVPKAAVTNNSSRVKRIKIEGEPTDVLAEGKTKSSGSKSHATASKASTASSIIKTNKRKRQDGAADVPAQAHPSKKANITKIILNMPTDRAQLRAQQQLDEDIKRFMKERPPNRNTVSPKRKREGSDEAAGHRPAKLQRLSPYVFEVLETTKLENMHEAINELFAQCASDFKPLQKIAAFVRCGKLKPQIIDTSLQEEAFHNRPSIKLVLPDHIKGFLVDDWENVTKNNQLVHLPHPKPVEVILQDYLAAEKPNREEDSTQMDILEETIAGLREYFDRALGRILLYRFERAQYADQQSKWSGENNKEGPSTTYGAEHLARLLVSLPELIAQTNMDQQSVGRLREEITKFTNWLGKNYATYWQKEYETPDAEYVASAKSG